MVGRRVCTSSVYCHSSTGNFREIDGWMLAKRKYEMKKKKEREREKHGGRSKRKKEEVEKGKEREREGEGKRVRIQVGKVDATSIWSPRQKRVMRFIEGGV